MRGLNNKVAGVTSAWFAFRDRYQAIPGDYTLADVNIAAGLRNGNGNGAIEFSPERSGVWSHLGASGFIKGNYDGVGTPLIERCRTSTCPDNGFGLGMVLSWDNRSLNTNLFGFELSSGRNIPIGIIAELDRKIDDGLPGSGDMRLLDRLVATCLNGTNYQLTTPSDNCMVVFRNFQ